MSNARAWPFDEDLRHAVTNIRAVVLDVRGTLISAVDDRPIQPQLRVLLRRLLDGNVPLAFVTGGSMQTLLDLVLAPLMQDHPFDGRLILAYVNNGSEGYLIENGAATRLPRYAVRRFGAARRTAILQSVGQIAASLNVRSVIKEKPGQINFYCDLPWDARRELAGDLRRALRARSVQRVHVAVPTAKPVLDVSTCTKGRAVRDFQTRIHMRAENLLILGDSFQAGGADVPMLRAAPTAIAVHVGPVGPIRGAFDAGARGPQGSAHVLSSLIRARQHLG